MLPEIDTIEKAYERAKRCQQRGLATVDVICDALNRTRKPIVEPFYGARGFVVQRYADEDGLIERLKVRVDVTDILVTAHDAWVRSLTPEQPKFQRRRTPRGVSSR